MNLKEEVKTLYQLVKPRQKGSNLKDRLNDFYGEQAHHYDDFRKRLLHGRETLMQTIPPLPTKKPTWIDVGGGTGSNLEINRAFTEQCKSVTIVDLARPLLDQAESRIQKNGWNHVDTLEDDFCETKNLPKADVITFSYSLTMIPNWFEALDKASTLLKKGGFIGVVDFYNARRGQGDLPFWQRVFWPIWFEFDYVFLNGDHLPYLDYRFEKNQLKKSQGSVPYLKLPVPYYVFWGKRK